MMTTTLPVRALSQNRVIVEIPTLEGPERAQVIIGKKSKVPGLEEFRGIPYGQVPARWQHSTVRKCLPADVFDARKNGPRCPQPQGPNNTATFQSHLDFPTDVGESEFECLNLFIVRPDPALVDSVKLPVYFYIHGGGYGFGAGTDPMWDPSRLVARSIAVGKPFVAVVINYRLNIFGFGCSPCIITAQPATSTTRGGNFGLRDQRVALDWVSKNIHYFGGDPTRITIGGQSAGSSSVHAHVIDAKLNSKLQKPPFRRAIMQSGAVGTLGPIPLAKAESNFNALQESLGVTKFEELLELSSEKLLQATQELGWWVFPLVDDGLTIGSSKVWRWNVSLGEQQHEPAYDKFKPKEPLMVMTCDTDTEGSIWKNDVQHVKDFSHLQQLLSPCLSRDVFNELARLYGLDASVPTVELHQGITQFLTDREFGRPVHLAYTELASSIVASAEDVYPTSTQTLRCKFGNPWSGPGYEVAHHCVDLIYIFDCFHLDIAKVDKLESGRKVANAQLVDTMQKQWIDFIADERPTVINEDEVLVYGTDRVGKVVRRKSDEDIVTRLNRIEFLGQYEDKLMEASCIITGITSV